MVSQIIAFAIVTAMVVLSALLPVLLAYWLVTEYPLAALAVGIVGFVADAGEAAGRDIDPETGATALRCIPGSALCLLSVAHGRVGRIILGSRSMKAPSPLRSPSVL